MTDLEKIAVANVFGGSNPTPGKLVQWVKNLDCDVVILSEVFNLRQELRAIPNSTLYTGDGGHGPTDTGILVFGKKADEHSVTQLTKNVVWNRQHPKLAHDRWVTRIRTNKKVYYSVHANAAIAGPEGNWGDNAGAREWRNEGIPKLKAMIKKDVQGGYAVRVGGDFNFPWSQSPPGNSPQDLFRDLGLDFMWDRVMWLAWDPRYSKVERKFELGIAPGSDAHRTLRVNLSPKERVPTGNPGPTEAGEGGTKTDELKLATVNLGRTLSDAQAKTDVQTVIKEWRPEFICVQNAHLRLAQLRAIPEYNLAVPKNAAPAEMANAIMFRNERYRLVGATAIKTAAGYINSGHFQHREYGTSVYVFNTHIERDNATREQITKHLTRMADIVKDRAKRANVAFWAGDFDIDEDADNKKDYKGFPNRIFNDAGLLSIYDELKTPASFDTYRNEKVDIIGSFKGDERVKALAVLRTKQQSSHHYVLGRYQLVTTERAMQGDDRGTPTSADFDPDPTAPRNPFEKDTGPSFNHEYCCGGRTV